MSLLCSFLVSCLASREWRLGAVVIGSLGLRVKCEGQQKVWWLWCVWRWAQLKVEWQCNTLMIRSRQRTLPSSATGITTMYMLWTPLISILCVLSKPNPTSFLGEWAFMISSHIIDFNSLVFVWKKMVMGLFCLHVVILMGLLLVRFMQLLQHQDLMVLTIFGIRIASKDLRYG